MSKMVGFEDPRAPRGSIRNKRVRKTVLEKKLRKCLENEGSYATTNYGAFVRSYRIRNPDSEGATIGLRKEFSERAEIKLTKCSSRSRRNNHDV